MLGDVQAERYLEDTPLNTHTHTQREREREREREAYKFLLLRGIKAGSHMYLQVKMA